jgi:hypothetical protein
MSLDVFAALLAGRQIETDINVLGKVPGCCFKQNWEKIYNKPASRFACRLRTFEFSFIRFAFRFLPTAGAILIRIL